MSNEQNTGGTSSTPSVTSEESRLQPAASGSDIAKEPTDSSDANSSPSQSVETQNDVNENPVEELVSLPPPPRKKASRIFPKPQVRPDAPSTKAQAPSSLSSVGSRRHSRTDTFGQIIPPDGFHRGRY
ncbi:unnamed protein product [Cyclocybe aegerita]|uniref:Uncharacterized protein n=1 Tax=Cyclocybe aegerita TaxID=1973307 RepID=A0A8S0VYS8_CYCAE|nr:unnamed protein product [Cyclocybe aegerita]